MMDCPSQMSICSLYSISPHHAHETSARTPSSQIDIDGIAHQPEHDDITILLAKSPLLSTLPPPTSTMSYTQNINKPQVILSQSQLLKCPSSSKYESMETFSSKSEKECLPHFITDRKSNHLNIKCQISRPRLPHHVKNDSCYNTFVYEQREEMDDTKWFSLIHISESVCKYSSCQFLKLETNMTDSLIPSAHCKEVVDTLEAVTKNRDSDPLYKLVSNRGNALERKHPSISKIKYLCINQCILSHNEYIIVSFLNSCFDSKQGQNNLKIYKLFLQNQLNKIEANNHHINCVSGFVCGYKSLNKLPDNSYATDISDLTKQYQQSSQDKSAKMYASGDDKSLQIADKNVSTTLTKCYETKVKNILDAQDFFMRINNLRKKCTTQVTKTIKGLNFTKLRTDKESQGLSHQTFNSKQKLSHRWNFPFQFLHLLILLLSITSTMGQRE